MKKLALLLCLCLGLFGGLRAQITFVAEHNETFSLFMDGNLVNSSPQSRVSVSADGQMHEYIVVTKRPVAKAASATFATRDAGLSVVVCYDRHCGILALHNVPMTQHPHQPRPPQIGMDERAFANLEQTFQSMSLESRRLDYARTALPKMRLSAEQIGRLAQTFTFESKKLDFLKIAYPACVDKPNYYTLLHLLTFNSHRRELTEFIQRQQ